ncbi:hypothetical protein MNV49_002818 [Pseudohyphozyma bogoriensis]|nr:hypothetical protein MNV49_002818 [Pseudohyphozyma bogoriensis]
MASNQTADAANSNPYIVFGRTLISVMYPPLAPGYKGRNDGLLALQSYLLCISALYLYLNVRHARKEGKDVWLARLVHRPQGKFIVFNQYYVYPIFTAISAVVWIAFLALLRGWVLNHEPDGTVFYWLLLCNLPMLACGWLVTFSVMAGANLASSRRSNPSHHYIPSKVINSLFLIIFPISVLAVLVTGLRGGGSFVHVYHTWEGVHNETASEAVAFNQTLTVAQVADEVLGLQKKWHKILGAASHDSVVVVRQAYVVNIVVTGLLIVTNVLGAIFLVLPLRVFNKQLVASDAPLVAPLGPLATEDTLRPEKPASSTLKLIRTMTMDQKSTASSEAGDEDSAFEDPHAQKSGEKVTRGSRLEWEVLLFYSTVLPGAALYIAIAAWVVDQIDNTFTKGNTTEIASTLFIWIISGTISITLTASCIKRFLTKPKPPAVSIYLPEPGPRRFVRPDSVLGGPPSPVRLPSYGESDDEDDLFDTCAGDMRRGFDFTRL